MSKPSFDFKAECKFLDLPPDELEAACFFEYCRESKTLRDAIKPDSNVHGPYLEGFAFEEYFSLARLLQDIEFPKQWNKLKKEREELVQFFAKRKQAKLEIQPPISIKELPIEPCYNETDPEGNYWKPASSAPIDGAGFQVCFGTIHIDPAYGIEEVTEAFKEWWKTRIQPDLGDSRDSRYSPQSRLNNLAVWRICKQIEDKRERVDLIAKHVGLKGCKDYSSGRHGRKYSGNDDEPISSNAKSEISQARKDAQSYLKSLFPTERAESLGITEGKS